MAKPELGTKRLCAGCGAKFYDLNKDPIVCPKCSTVFEIAPSLRPRPEAAGAEFVSLEEADKEAEGAKPVAAEGSEDEVEVEDTPIDDGAFVVPEEEEEDDVTDIIGEGIEDDEET